MSEKPPMQAEEKVERAFILFRQDEPGNHEGYPVAVYTEDQREACVADRDHRQSVNPKAHYYVLDKKLNPKPAPAPPDADSKGDPFVEPSRITFVEKLQHPPLPDAEGEQRSIEDIRATGAAWVTEAELEWLCTKAARTEEVEEEQQAVLNCINLYGDETLHKALDDIGYLSRSPEEGEA